MTRATASSPGGPRWYVAQTLPGREFGAAAQLRAQHYVGFLPTIQKTVRHARKLRTVTAPLFPRYLFVELDLQRDPWRSVNGTFGISRLIMARDRPAPVPVGVVDQLLSCSDMAGMIDTSSKLQAGDRVRVLTGPFAQCLGVLDRLEGDARVRVLLEIMGGSIPTRLDLAQLAEA